MTVLPRPVAFPAVFLALFLAFATRPTPARAQEPEVRLWAPFARDGLPHSCLAADLADWMRAAPGLSGEAPVDHRLVALPDGKFEDQVRAALQTGEQPDLLMIDVSAFDLVSTLGEGFFFGADLIGLWVDGRKIAQLPQGTAGLEALWLGDAARALGGADDLLLLLRETGHTPLGIDSGPRGADLGLALALMMDQWTNAFEPLAPGDLSPPTLPPGGSVFGGSVNWNDGRLELLFATLARWQNEGLLIETDLESDLESQPNALDLPVLILARYSQGKKLGQDWAFYPLFSGLEGKAATFLELPLNWFSLRPDDRALAQPLIEAIDEGRVFETCAQTAGLISRAQLETLDDTPVLSLFAEAQGQILPADLPVDITEWTGQQPALPADLANTLRDMRAGLDPRVALRMLRALYEDTSN